MPHRTGWALIAVAVVVLFGVRNLVTGHLPMVGQLLAFPAPSALLRDFFGGWHDAGWQTTGPASPGFGLVGLAGAILFGSTAQVEKLLVLGPILVGAIGMHRLLRAIGSSRARLAGTIAYLGLPLVWNGIAAGDLQALVTFAGMPFVMSRLCRATGLGPFSPPQDPQGRRGFLAEVIPFGLLLAVMAGLAPPSLVAVVVLALAIVLGAAVTGHLAAVGRALGVTAGALAVAFLCCLPWSLTFLQPGARWSVLSGARGARGEVGGVLRLLRFDVGPVGAGWLVWGIPLGAALALFVARDERLDWATRWWVAALATVAVAYAAAVGWLGAGGGATLVTPGPGVRAASPERSGSAWRRSRSTSPRLASAGAESQRGSRRVPGCRVVPHARLVGGRPLVAPLGRLRAASQLDRAPTGAPGFDVLWLGDPAAVPAPCWQIRPGLAFAVSEDGLPDGRRLWPSANPGVGATVEADLERAESGLTVQLGAELARAGIRYLILPGADRPDPSRRPGPAPGSAAAEPRTGARGPGRPSPAPDRGGCDRLRERGLDRGRQLVGRRRGAARRNRGRDPVMAEGARRRRRLVGRGPWYRRGRSPPPQAPPLCPPGRRPAGRRLRAPR